jgi:cell division protein FtsI (penicillin-binding protein 3)
VQIQVIEAPALAAAAAESRAREVLLPGKRGDILDRNGAPLATSVDARDITVDQTLITDPEATALQLMPILQMKKKDLIKILTGTQRFAYVAREVTPEQWGSIRQLQIPGIFSERTTTRVYPTSSTAAGLIGFVGTDGHGLAGLEYALEDTLAGSDTLMVYEAAAGGRRIPIAGEQTQDPTAGQSVMLTIDRDLQWVAQQAINRGVRDAAADNGSIVVLDPKSGDILALASAPTFDPNKVTEASQDELNNRALIDIFEPGSTTKVITVAAAINEGVAKPSTQISVPSSLKRGDKRFKDSTPHGGLNLTLHGMLTKSSNIGAIKAAELVGGPNFYQYLRDFGVGSPTGLDLPGESAGVVPAPDQWSQTTFPTLAFGQGMAVNAVQMATIFGVIANGGLRVSPRLIAGQLTDGGVFEPSERPEPVRVVTQRTAKTVLGMMEAVVSEEGTAPLAQVPGYRVAGKTGTATRIDPACGCYRGYVASFIGVAPADSPALVVGVTLNNPKNGYYGGDLAAPVFADFANSALALMEVPPSSGRAPKYAMSW